MATETLNGPLGEVRAVSTASGGTALTSTAATIILPFGAKYMALIPRNYAGAAVVKFNKNPWLRIFKTQDSLTSEPTPYEIQAQDNSTSTDITLSSQGTAADGDFLYVGSYTPFSGVTIDIDGANGNASVLTVNYWDGSAWTDTSATDNTASGGASLAVDGTVTWTVPSDWATTSLLASGDTLLKLGMAQEPLFWTRWEFSAALDSAVTLNSMIAINRNTNYAELPQGVAWEEAVTVGPGGISGVTALTDAGTANLIVNVATRSGGRF